MTNTKKASDLKSLAFYLFSCFITQINNLGQLCRSRVASISPIINLLGLSHLRIDSMTTSNLTLRRKPYPTLSSNLLASSYSNSNAKHNLNKTFLETVSYFWILFHYINYQVNKKSWIRGSIKLEALASPMCSWGGR